MIDPKQLLDDLQSLLTKTIEPDLRERSELPEIAAALTEEFEVAKKAERTALNYTDWRSDYITQIGVGWVLSCVFIRFLEDNDLIDPPKLSGPAQTDDGSQTSLQRARDEYDLYIKANPTHSFREYILSVVDQLAKLPGVGDIFGDKNVIHQQPDWLSNDAAKALYNFWQTIVPETGRLVHNFVDDTGSETFDTRFLGDLYQDLSERARKKYALLQTPDFVEEFILDRTLEPALDEFGLTPGMLTAESASELTADCFLKMIDPACGSGHFLLGAFPRILRRWQQKEPGTKVDVLVQRTLYSIHGVDINPFAIAIARFRLLLASLKACGIERLKDAIDFDLSNLACGDSLYHGRQKQKTLGDWTDESHYFQTEDADNLKRILQEGTFHAVVANPPYIVPKDRAANVVYRELYSTCHKRYSLAVPFMERIYKLAVRGTDTSGAGSTGQITANSFMKREFGKPLIEEFLAKVDQQIVIDAGGAFIPGHATPTVILFGQNRKPMSSSIRVVMGLRGEPETPDDPARGKVWTAILNQLDEPGSLTRFINVEDLSRTLTDKHPWSFSGGGALDLKNDLESSGNVKLQNVIDEIGLTCITKADDIFPQDVKVFRRHKCETQFLRPFGTGETIRDWKRANEDYVIFPYDKNVGRASILEMPNIHRFLWSSKPILGSRKVFGGETYFEAGKPWFEYGQIPVERFKNVPSLVFAFVASHNHFVYERDPVVFKQSAPVIKLKRDANPNDFLLLLGLLNSSTCCFWLKQVSQRKQMTGGETVRIEAKSKVPHEFAGTQMKKMPIPTEFGNAGKLEKTLLSLSQFAESNGRLLEELTAVNTIQSALATGEEIQSLWREALKKRSRLQSQLVFIQEEIDFTVYCLYGIVDSDLLDAKWAESVDSIDVVLGQRPFELSDGESPEGYTVSQPNFGSNERLSQLWNKRQEEISTNKNLKLIEDPHYKRRWIGRQGKYNKTIQDDDLSAACTEFLTDRLESYFDFDGRMSEQSKDSPGSGETPLLADVQLVSVAKLADVAAKDSQFIKVANVYRDREDFDIVKLVDELVSEEHVPALPILRYKPSGLDKRAAWEETWELQRAEDAIEARIRTQLDGFLKMGGKKKDKEGAFHNELPTDSPLLEFFSKPKSETEEEDDKKKKKKKSGIDDGFLSVDEIVRRVVKQERGEIPVPPKYASKDMISTGGAKYWKPVSYTHLTLPTKRIV